MLPHSFLWGHLIQAYAIESQLPIDAHITNLLSGMMKRLSTQFPKSDSVYYVDLWPFSPSLMVVGSPSLASQAVQHQSLRKPSTLTDLFYPITGGSRPYFHEWRTTEKEPQCIQSRFQSKLSSQPGSSNYGRIHRL